MPLNIEDSYTKKEVARVTGIPYRNVQFYTEQDVVPPEVEEGSGRGKFRRYSTNNLISFLLAGELAQYGMTVSEIRDAVTLLNVFWHFSGYIPPLETRLKLYGSPTVKYVDFGSKEEWTLKIFEGLIELKYRVRIGRTKDNKRIISLTMGGTKSGHTDNIFSFIKDQSGKIIQCFTDNNRKTTNQSEIQILNRHGHKRIIRKTDIEMPKDSDLVSYIFVALYELLDDASERLK